ncbi:hypothetical protein [Nocardia terpenica]|uniref:Uncharacterized protein n=1 Tax=Nocardia terpenica TaxID=455432 RepID=A0A164HFP6_9NOCA|nr:hypothetical protein [Nocardia terpenica]KZM68474.1 hypothetical protein AWN90_11430 [Nocardia terpenica]NQE88576.1 hypothetical protein [Nocardia terpenica]
MPNPVIKWNINGFYRLRKAPGVIVDLVERAERIKAAAEAEGGEYEIYSQQGNPGPPGKNSRGGGAGHQGRWRVSVTTADPKAMHKNATGKPLLRAVDRGR